MPDLWLDVNVALAEVPVNKVQLIDDTDFKTREEAVTYNQAGIDLVWNFVTPAGAMTQTAVTPTTAGDYDWTDQTNAFYAIEMPASGGASINNDTEGFGWFAGYATGIMPWIGPIIGFRAAGLNALLVEDAYSTTRGLSGTALPNAAADAALGLPISDAGGLDLDGVLSGNTPQTGDTYARLGAPAGASIAADLVVIDNFVDGLETTIGVAGAGLSDITINAASVDAIMDETFTQPTATFTWPATLRTVIPWLGVKSRNKMTQTSTTTTIRNDADGGDVSTSTVSDNGTTTTRGEFS